MRVTYIGHATLLIEMGGLRLLTDPNFDPKLGKILPRVSAPGIPLDQLPQLDAVLLTHAHADHLSFDSLDRLPKSTPVFAPPAVATWLNRLGYRHVNALPPGEELTLGALRINAAVATHRGNRYGFDRWRADASMYLLTSDAESCFFAGDTALFGDMKFIGMDKVDVMLTCIGDHFTMGPKDAAMAVMLVHPKVVIPMHYGTFPILTGTPEAFRKALKADHAKAKLEVMQVGQTLDF